MANGRQTTCDLAVLHTTIMLLPEALLRILVRFPKLLVAIAKRCSSATSHFLRYIFSFWNASVQKSRERKHFAKSNGDKCSPSIAPRNDIEKGEVEAGADFRSATIQRSSDRGLAQSQTISTVADAGRPQVSQTAEGRGSNRLILSSKPPFRKSMLLCDMVTGILSMLFVLDHPGFIARALRATQRKTEQEDAAPEPEATPQNHDRKTDVEKWVVFTDTFQKDIENINLLATVLLTANFSFLAIQSIDQNGLSYLPQRLSYTSLLSAMGSILMGLAVRTPRFFTAHTSRYFKVMALVLGFPFELFLYSMLFFIAALVVHFSIHTAKFQIVAASLIFGFVIICLGLYWLVTEPKEELMICCPKGTAEQRCGCCSK